MIIKNLGLACVDYVTVDWDEAGSVMEMIGTSGSGAVKIRAEFVGDRDAGRYVARNICREAWGTSTCITAGRSEEVFYNIDEMEAREARGEPHGVPQPKFTVEQKTWLQFGLALVDPETVKYLIAQADDRKNESYMTLVASMIDTVDDETVQVRMGMYTVEELHDTCDKIARKCWGDDYKVVDTSPNERQYLSIHREIRAVLTLEGKETANE